MKKHQFFAAGGDQTTHKKGCFLAIRLADLDLKISSKHPAVIKWDPVVWGDQTWC